MSCPWCEGTGRFIAGHDAQQSPAESAKAVAGTPATGGAEAGAGALAAEISERADSPPPGES